MHSLWFSLHEFILRGFSVLVPLFMSLIPILPGGLNGSVCPAVNLLVGLKEDTPPWPCSRGQDAEHPVWNTYSPECCIWVPQSPSAAHARTWTVNLVLQQPGRPPGLRGLSASQRRKWRLRKGSDLSRAPWCISEGEGERTRPSFQSRTRAQWLENGLWCHPTVWPCTIY